MSPRKEPCFFALRVMNVDLSTPEAQKIWAGAVTNEEEYRALFANDGRIGIRAYGECSPVYLPISQTAYSIARSIPDARLIAVLRDPVDRAISHHAHNVGIGVEPNADFAEALAADDAMGGWQYFRQGCYAQMLAPYLWFFNPDQLLLIEYSQLYRDPSAMFSTIWNHIGVDPVELPESMPRILPTEPSEVGRDVREALAARYRQDTRNLIQDFGFLAAAEWITA